MHVLDLMAGIYYNLLKMFWTAGIQKLMDYFSLVPKNSKLERNEAFLAEIILCFIMWDFLRHTGIRGLANFLYGII